MARLPVVSGVEAVKVFEKAGWTIDRQRGGERPQSNWAAARFRSFPARGMPRGMDRARRWGYPSEC